MPENTLWGTLFSLIHWFSLLMSWVLMMQGYCREPHPDTLVLSLPFSHTPVGLHGSLQPDVAVLLPSFSFVYRWNPGICFHVSCTLYIISPIPQSEGDLHLTLSPDNFICSLFGTIFIVQHCHYYYFCLLHLPICLYFSKHWQSHWFLAKRQQAMQASGSPIHPWENGAWEGDTRGHN